MLHAPTLLPRSLGPRPSAVGQTVPTLNRVHLYKTRQEPNPYAAQHLPLTHERHRSNRTRAGATPEPSSPQGSSPLILDSAASSRLWYPVQEPFTWQVSKRVLHSAHLDGLLSVETNVPCATHLALPV